MIFASTYPIYLNRLDENGKTEEKINLLIEWFSSFDQVVLQALINKKLKCIKILT